MVPARLSLRNFLCYRDNCPPLDFSGIQVACLTGENGNGKSALLDAMTWALWGQARARSDDELIHLGRTEMEVELEFFAGEQRYRVIRKRKKGTQRSPGSTTLEFHIIAPEGWRALTANHVRETERKVCDVLKLDYETFVNSAFLLQGRADAFTLKTPGERKRILAEILGLSQYDELEQEARFERGLRDDQVRGLERELHDIGDALALEDGYAAEREQLTEALVALREELAAESRRLETLRQTERLLSLQRDQAAAAGRRHGEALAEVRRARGAVEQHERGIAALDAVLASASVIEDGYRRLQQTRLDEQALSARFRAHAALVQEQTSRRASVERAQLELTGSERLLLETVKRLESAIGGGDVRETERRDLAQLAMTVQEHDVRLSDLRAEGQELREAIGALRSENTTLRAEMEEIKRKQNDLSAVTVCPLCKTELGKDGQRHIVDAYEAEGRSLAGRFRENRTRIEESEALDARARSDVGAVEAEVKRAQTTFARRSAALEAAEEATAEASRQLAPQSQELAVVRSRLEQENYATDDRTRLAALDREIAALRYDAARHGQIRDDLQHLLEFEQRHRDLDVARARQESEQSALLTARRVLADWEARLVEAAADVEQARALLSQQPDTRRAVADAEERVHFLQGRQQAFQQALGAAEQKLDDCARFRQLEAERSTELKRALRERGIYEELMAAFSRRGIQALIIDSVLPEITEEANRLLARMTNNRLRVMMETQRLTQKGAVTETLDIRISDELGTRNYELFSGGEAFRVNLALRIALSKLLAHRAGAPLPTLIIDEGFGSQDAAALERLIEAINIIQSDFRCLLIITHLAELKDQFPVQIAVSKTADGAIATVNM